MISFIKMAGKSDCVTLKMTFHNQEDQDDARDEKAVQCKRSFPVACLFTDFFDPNCYYLSFHLSCYHLFYSYFIELPLFLLQSTQNWSYSLLCNFIVQSEPCFINNNSWNSLGKLLLNINKCNILNKGSECHDYSLSYGVIGKYEDFSQGF